MPDRTNQGFSDCSIYRKRSFCFLHVAKPLELPETWTGKSLVAEEKIVCGRSAAVRFVPTWRLGGWCLPYSRDPRRSQVLTAEGSRATGNLIFDSGISAYEPFTSSGIVTLRKKINAIPGSLEFHPLECSQITSGSGAATTPFITTSTTTLAAPRDLSPALGAPWTRQGQPYPGVFLRVTLVRRSEIHEQPAMGGEPGQPQCPGSHADTVALAHSDNPYPGWRRPRVCFNAADLSILSVSKPGPSDPHAERV